MPRRQQRITPRDIFKDYFGFNPHGNNKKFKELKQKYGNPVLTTPKQKKDFFLKVVKEDKLAKPATVIQGLFKRLSLERKRYIETFKQDLYSNKPSITLYSSEIKKYSDFKNIVEIIQDSMIMKQENIYIEVNGRNYTLTPENINLILEKIKKGDMEENAEIYEDSKTEIGYWIMSAEVITINRTKKTNKYKFIEGAFFPYYLKEGININLDDFQIYKKQLDDNQRNLDNCLLYSLKIYGIEESLLETVKDMIKLKHIPLCDIPKLCDRLKIGIVIWKEETGQVRKKSFGSIYDISVDIGYIENHYFLIKDVEYTSYSIKNYESINHLENFNMIAKKDNKKRKDRFINSYTLLQIMMENKDYFFEKINAGNINKYDEVYLDKLKENTFESLEYGECDYRKVEFDKTKIEPDLEYNEKQKIIYFDFETGRIERKVLCAKTDKYINQVFVEPFLCCTIDNDGNKKSFVGSNCAFEMLASLKKDSILIAHNAKFDYTFLTKHLWKCKEICNGSAFITFTGYFGKIKVQIKDSVKLIPMRLAEFPKAFKLGYVKEFMPYTLYDNDNINIRYIPYEVCLDYINNDDDKKIFDDNINKWNLSKDDNIDMIEYARRYCEIDVELLRDGYNIFRDNCITHFNIDVNKILTIPTLADKYFIIQGCYDGVYELAGQPRQFIQNCIVGGRTMCCNNEKILLQDKKINDFDAVSLYPSAMNRIDGFLKGLPKVLISTDYDVVKNYDGYFVQIRVKKININRKFALCSYVDKETGVRNFTNDLVDRIVYIDKTGLEDLIRFQGVEFEIIKGYYFNEGFNNKINEVVRFIFNRRLELKKEGNVGQLIYKLIMNSGYGKAIQKSNDTDTKLFDNRNEFDTYLSRNYNKIKNWIYYNDDNKVKCVVGSTMTDHFNRCHVGVEILSMSKRIMNEVICLAEDNNLNIYYQDTDSIHIEDKDIKSLEQLFKKQYGRDLIGNDMGQFHSDFELKGADKNIVATDSVFLGKKSYIDKLVGEDKDGNIVDGYHYRMKGIPSKAIKYHCEVNSINVLDLYKKLYKGDEVVFDLTCGGEAFTIKHQNDYKIKILDEFKRKVKF